MLRLPSELELIVGAVALASALGGAAWFIHHERELGATDVRNQVAAVSAAAAASTAATEARWQATSQETVHVAQVQLAAASAAAAGADRQRDLLLVQLNRLRASAVPGNPAASSPGADLGGDDPIGVLANVLGRSDARASVVDKLADERRIRAEACERSYDSLK